MLPVQPYTLSEIRRGVVVRWGGRGFGFIQDADSGQSIFTNITDIQDEELPRLGDACEYMVLRTVKGLRCVQVRLLKNARATVARQVSAEQAAQEAAATHYTPRLLLGLKRGGAK